MMRCAITVLLAACATSCIGTVPSGLPSAASVKYPLEDKVAASGTHVVLESAPDYGASAVVVSIAAGSSQDPPKKAGLAHLVEHLVFQSRQGKASFWQRLHALGGIETNGTTNWDTTTFCTVVPTANTKRALEVLSEVFADPLATITENDFEAERQIVRDEMHLRYENGVDGQALNWLLPALFPEGHGYAQPLGGSLESIAGLTLADAREFAKHWYVSSKGAVVVSAPAPVSEQWNWVSQVLKPLGKSRTPTADLPTDPSLEPPAGSAPLRSFEAPVPSTTLWIAWRIPTLWSGDGLPGELLPSVAEAAFSIGSTEQRFDSAVHRIDADVISAHKAAAFLVKASLDDAGNPSATLETLIGQLRHAMTEVLFDGFHYQYLNQEAALSDKFGDENILSRALRMNKAQNAVHEPLFLRHNDTRIQALRNSAVSDMLQKYITPARARAIVVKPLASSRDAAAKQRQGSAGRVDRPGEDATIDPAVSRLWVRQLDEDRIVRKQLDSGLEIWVWRQPRSAYHTALLGFHGGHEIEPKPGVGTAMLWSRRYPPPPGNFFGLMRHFQVHDSSTVASTRGIGHDLRTTLEALRYQVDFSVFWTPKQFTRQIDLFKKQESQPGMRLSREMRRLLFGEHVLGRNANVDQVKSVSPNDVYRWLSLIRRPSNAILVFVGDEDPKVVFDAAEDIFGNFGEGQKEQPPIPLPPPLAEKARPEGLQTVFNTYPGLTQSRFSMLCALPNMDGDKWAAAHLFEEILYGKLWGQLRERKQVSYSVMPELSAFRGGTVTLGFEGDLDPSSTPDFTSMVRLALGPDAPTLVDEDSMKIARARLAAQSTWLDSTTFTLAQRLFFAWNQDWAIRNVLNVGQHGFSIDPKTVREMETACRKSAMVGFVEPGLGRP